jgi:hypothetical protein
MGTKNKNRSPEEYYKGEIRKLKKEVRQLRKQLNQNTHEQSDEELASDSEDTMVTKLHTCMSCGKGKLIEFELMDKAWGTCNLCNERKRLR